MSAAPKRGLGRGLGALIPSAAAEGDPVADAIDAGGPTATPGAVYAELPIDLVVPNPRQPRAVFDEDALAELVFSIREIGLL